jgi:fumarylacetoacetase
MNASWVDVPEGSDFPLDNLPYGAFRPHDGDTHLGVAIGDSILDLHAVAEFGAFDEIGARAAFAEPTLNAFLRLGRATWRAVRERLQALLAKDGDPALRDLPRARFFVERGGVEMAMSLEVADYVDFYSSEQHARNLGSIFRPDAEPLLPNWKWMPIGYHGRAGTIVVSGTPILRPDGQRKPPDAPAPSFGPSAMLDIELELGFITGSEEIFGLVLVNDWSARDIQAWEYQPLGPFLGKSFATTISPWVVTLDALAPFRVAPPSQEPPPLPYLRFENDTGYDVCLTIELRSARMREGDMAPVRISATNARELYWTMAQQLAHVRSNGTRIRPGDLFASGTISGAEAGSYGSFIELTWRGTKPLTLPTGEKRAFLEDGDEVTLRGWCERDGLRLGFGECTGNIVAHTGVSSQER